jgi:hypothetical protein
MSDSNLTSTDEAAAEIQAPTTQTWAGDDAQNRCTATHLLSTPVGDTSVRCDGAAGHGGAHHGHDGDDVVQWENGG